MNRMLTLAGALSLAAGAACGQTVQALSVLDGYDGAAAYDINDAGQIVGFSQNNAGTAFHATLWNTDGTTTDLGVAAGSVGSVAYAINNAGHTVGYSEASSGLRTATLWDGSGPFDLGAAMGSTGSSVAWDINNADTVVGQAPLNPGFAKGFVWDATNGGRTAGGSSFYMGGGNYGVNDAGVLVGSGFFFGDPDDAFLSRPDGRGGYEDSDIAPPGYNLSIARAISNTDICVGYTDYGLNTGGWQAAIFNGRGDVTLLGTLDELENSEAQAVNDAGMVVGFAWDNDFELDSAAWAYVNGTMYDLNDFIAGSGFARLYQATGVNNNGDIVGYGMLDDGSLSAFVIHGFVPAPGTAGVLALAGVLGARRRR